MHSISFNVSFTLRFHYFNTLAVEYASRYSVPQARSLHHEGSDRAMESGPNACTSATSSSTAENPPNMERRERYTLRDILVDDLDIETSEAPEDLFGEIRLPPSLLVEERAIPQRQDCGKSRDEVILEDNLNSIVKLNEMPQNSKRQIEPLERHPFKVHKKSKEIKTKVSSLKKFKTFFKLTL